jgi:hypothetical protein
VDEQQIEVTRLPEFAIARDRISIIAGVYSLTK